MQIITVMNGCAGASVERESEMVGNIEIEVMEAEQESSGNTNTLKV